MSSFEPFDEPVESPAAQLVVELRAERERGTSFPIAYDLAVRRVLSRVQERWERAQWITVFDETADAWWAAYENRPVRADAAALLRLEDAIL